ncbi:hypothetical protein LSH36_344g00011 [Paralvinella palmiformis]|uniref:LYR motif-containing protein 9 n=1 Tax=Paralvinella palmiformis TaxID=53620 RepID=A0AAD9JFZ3_9ANNE|nr:hypothetical protein LSH36_344g00011 [Paralvinella palmiformis]
MNRPTKAITSSLHLYKYLLRNIKRLPAKSQGYYKNYVKQGFKSHADEDDPERVKQIISRALEDAEWIIKKYTKT